MWPSLMKKAKEGGLNAIETYVFWNAHEPLYRQVCCIFNEVYVSDKCLLHGLCLCVIQLEIDYTCTSLCYAKTRICKIYELRTKTQDSHRNPRREKITNRE